MPSGVCQEGDRGGRTGDVVIEDVIFVDRAVDDPLGDLVENQDFPLAGGRERQKQARLFQLGRRRRAGGASLTSFWAVLRMASMIAGGGGGAPGQKSSAAGKALGGVGRPVADIPLPCSLMMEGPSMTAARCGQSPAPAQVGPSGQQQQQAAASSKQQAVGSA